MEFQFLSRGQNQSTLEKMADKRTYIKFKQHGLQLRAQCWKAFALRATAAPSIFSLHGSMKAYVLYKTLYPLSSRYKTV